MALIAVRQPNLSKKPKSQTQFLNSAMIHQELEKSVHFDHLLVHRYFVQLDESARQVFDQSFGQTLVINYFDAAPSFELQKVPFIDKIKAFKKIY